MAKRGDKAREEITNTIVEAFGNKGTFVGIQDKKIYVIGNDGGEQMQFAISFSMTKTPLKPADGGAPSGEPFSVEKATATPKDISDEDRKKVAELMERLGLKDE